MSRSFGDKRLKEHISSEPDVCVEEVDADTEFMNLASDGVWKVGYNLQITSLNSTKTMKLFYACEFVFWAGYV